MKLFVALSFLVLAVLYWAASGGAGFAPEARPETAPEASQAEVEALEAAIAPTAPPAAPASQTAPQAVPPEGLPASPLDPDAALAALAADLADPAEATPAGTEPAAAEPAAGPLREVMGDAVNVRAGPGTGFDVVGRLRRGERAEVLALQDGWASVRAGGVEGWMSERFLAAP